MQHFGRLSGIGVILLSATALTACYTTPPPRLETPPPAPSALAIWQLGHRYWSGSHYAWIYRVIMSSGQRQRRIGCPVTGSRDRRAGAG